MSFESGDLIGHVTLSRTLAKSAASNTAFGCPERGDPFSTMGFERSWIRHEPIIGFAFTKVIVEVMGLSANTHEKNIVVGVRIFIVRNLIGVAVKSELTVGSQVSEALN